MASGEEDNLSPVEDDLEIIEEPENEEHVQQTNETEETPQNQEVEGETDNKKEVKVKRVRNPQPKLNVERLKGPRGLRMLENVFKDVKFKGHGHEEEDLGVLMKNYEYWCHRLFPKFPFDDCLERMERLGSKKQLQTYIKRIRMNLLLDDDETQQQDVTEAIGRDDEEEEVTQFSNFDDLITSQQPTTSCSAGLSDEQLERIRINRERAQRLRQQMLIRDRSIVTDVSNESVNVLSSQNSEANVNDIIFASSENSSICDALKNVDFTEDMSVDSETCVSSQPAAETKSIQKSGVVESNRIASQASDSQILTEVTSHETPASQESSFSGEINSQISYTQGSIFSSQQSVTDISCEDEAADSCKLVKNTTVDTQSSVEVMSIDSERSSTGTGSSLHETAENRKEELSNEIGSHSSTTADSIVPETITTESHKDTSIDYIMEVDESEN